MARDVNVTAWCGAIRDHNTTDIGSPDGFSAGTALTTTSTTLHRGSGTSIACPGTSTATSYRAFPFTAKAAGTSLFKRFYFRVSALPNATKKIARFGTTAYGSVRLTSAGKLQLWNDTGTPAQIGSDSALTVAVDTWYRVELKQTIGTGAVDALELRAKRDGPDSIYPVETVAGGASLSLSDTQPVRFEAGWIDAPGVTSTMCLTDGALNDSTGTQQTGWPGDEHVVVMVPNTASGPSSFGPCSMVLSMAEVVKCLDNLPPIGIAHHGDSTHTSEGEHHQVDHPGGAAETLTLMFPSYGRFGIAGNVKQEDTAYTTTYSASNTPGFERKIAQSFMGAGTLGSVDLYLTRTSHSTTFTYTETVQIQSDSGGLPSGTVLASASKNSLDIPTGPGWVSWDLPDIPLTPGATYWIVLSTTRAGPSNEVLWSARATAAADYPDGTCAHHVSGAWTLGTLTPTTQRDMAFRMFTSTGVSPITVVQPVACHGEAIGTGSKTGSVELDQNPVVAAKTFTFGDNVGDAGTYGDPATGNWRWVRGNVGYNPTFTNMAATPRMLFKRTDTTSRAALACCTAVIVAYQDVPPPGWRQVTRTSDSSLHWVKQAPNTMTMAKSDDTEVTAMSGDFFVTPDPLPDDGAHATLSTITIATLQADYTGW